MNCLEDKWRTNETCLDDVLSELRIPTAHPCLSLLHLKHHASPNKAPYAIPSTENAIFSRGHSQECIQFTTQDIRRVNAYRDPD